jgi:Transcriptional regulators of sugar metabolism
MLALTRKNKIQDMLTEHKSVTVTELSKYFEVTEETIRRDLKSLEDMGLLTRTYGGAFIQEGVENNVKISLREVAYTESKMTIAKACRNIIQNGNSIFLDPSTTSLFIAKTIQNMRLTVVTNSLLIVDQLADCENIRLICIGGALSRDNKAFHGNVAAQMLDFFYLDKAFISCRSLSIEHGITDASESIGRMRHKLLSRSNETYLIADHSKFNKTSFLHICNFEDLFGIISDFKYTPEWIELLHKKNVKIIDCPSTQNEP